MLRHDRTPFALQPAHRFVGVDCYHQLPPERLRSAQIAHMPHVQQIEVAVGQRDTLARTPPILDPAAEFLATQGFVVYVQCDRVAGGVCSMACSNSSRETVAVPRFITTRPPA